MKRVIEELGAGEEVIEELGALSRMLVDVKKVTEELGASGSRLVQVKKVIEELGASAEGWCRWRRWSKNWVPRQKVGAGEEVDRRVGSHTLI